eukprot:COSAG01_NODE_2428_length_7717_cov_5.280126_3_plen_370_part_00
MARRTPPALLPTLLLLAALLLLVAPSVSHSPAPPRRTATGVGPAGVMSIGWFDMRSGFLACEPDDGVGLSFEYLSHVTLNGCGMHTSNWTLDCHSRDGSVNETTVARLTSAAHAQGTQVVLGLDLACPKKAGIAKCPLWQPGPQRSYIASVVDYVRRHELDGVELDYEEFGVGDADDIKGRSLYSGLLVALKVELHRNVHPVGGVLVGVCLASFDRNPFIFVNNSSMLVESVDYYNVMSYEWSADGRFENAKTAVATIHQAGFPQQRINMGVAFYGRGGQDYCSLLAACGPPGSTACTNCSDPQSNFCAGKLFDGQAMQRSMGSWVAGSDYGGVLIFQVNYDHNNVLLNALGKGLNDPEFPLRLKQATV